MGITAFLRWDFEGDDRVWIVEGLGNKIRWYADKIQEVVKLGKYSIAVDLLYL